MRLGGSWIHVRTVVVEGNDTIFNGRYDRQASDTNRLATEYVLTFSGGTALEYFRGESCWYVDSYPYETFGDTLACRRPRCIDRTAFVSRPYKSYYLVVFAGDSVGLRPLVRDTTEADHTDYYRRYHGALPLPEWPDSACGRRRCPPGLSRSDF
jgi:hypothetical protein